MSLGFQEYPKRMSHKDHQDAIWEQLPGKGTGLFVPDTVMKSPERFPEVVVHTLDQEKLYASRGYRPNNMANAAEYEQAILEQNPVEGYVPQEYPKWRYHPIEISRIVHSAEENEALGEGWFDYPVEATEDDLPAEPTKAEISADSVDEHELEAARLKAEREAFEKEKTEWLAKQKAEAQSPPAIDLDKMTSGVERHGLKKIDKRSKAYKDTQKAKGA